MSARVSTITCFLCGGRHVYPGPRFEAHLINEHGALYDIDFLISISDYKTKNDSLPKLLLSGESPGDKTPAPPKPEVASVSVQTDPDLLPSSVSSSSDPHQQHNHQLTNGHVAEEVESTPLLPVVKNEPGGDAEYEPYDDQDDISLATTHQSLEDSGSLYHEQVDKITVWNCPLCPKIFKKIASIKTHLSVSHQIKSQDYDKLESVDMTEEEYLNIRKDLEQDEKPVYAKPKSAAVRQSSAAKSSLKKKQGSFGGVSGKLGIFGSSSGSGKTRKIVGNKWKPNSFASRYRCYFCQEEFRKDYKLKLHLMMKHKGEPPDQMEKAREELIKSKLDGCIHKCGLCNNKYNATANFARHIKDVHNMTREEYRRDYGSSEIVSRMFECEICHREIKHTRNIIGSHMKLVHLISWKEYQDIVAKMKSGEKDASMLSLPNPELFECFICGVSVKYKREHLTKKHQIDEDVYHELIEKKDQGEDISSFLPEREIYHCLICERECMDLRKHLQLVHKITEEEYSREFLNGDKPVPITHKQIMVSSPHTPVVSKPSPKTAVSLSNSSKAAKSPASQKTPGNKGHSTWQNDSPDGIKGKVKVAPLSTDLRCYFDCEETFKKDYELYLHLKLKHGDEPQTERDKALAAAKEEIELTRRSASVFTCALCTRVFNDSGAFYSHIQTKHDMSYMDYKEKYGRCETESKPFECTICSKVIKHDRNTVHTHLKNVHGINWTKYLDRVRKVRRGLEPDPLPAMKTVECRVCGMNVKYLRDHLRNNHKITEAEYEDLFGDDDDDYKKKRGKKRKPDSDEEDDSLEGFSVPSSFIEASYEEQPSLTEVLEQHCGGQQQQQHSGGLILGDPRSTVVLEQPSHEIMGIKTEPPEELPLEVDLRSVRPAKEDVTNNANTTCAVCSIKFCVRREFIQHCQVVHGMKFKNRKSGRPIPPPPNSMLNSNSSAVKRIKPEPEGDSSEHHNHHHQQLHHEQQLQQTVKKIRTSDGYEIEIEGSTSSSSFTSSSGTPSLSAAVSTTKTAKSGPGGKSMYPHTTKLSKWNLCSYRCGVCEKTSLSKKSIQGHIAETHSLTTQEYNMSYPDLEVAAEWFYCRICHNSVKFTKDTITAHLKVHKTDLEDYERDVMEEEDWPNHPGHVSVPAVSNQKTPRSSSSTGTKMTSSSTSLKKKKAARKLSSGSVTSRRSSSGVYSGSSLSGEVYESVSVPFPGDNSGVLGGADNQDVNRDNSAYNKLKDKWNRCIFKCPICEKMSNLRKDIRSHSVEEHGVALEDLEARLGDAELHTELFNCKLCESRVKHIYKNISAHLMKSHKMSPEEYEAQCLGITSLPREKDDKQYRCQYCSKLFSSVSNRTRHVRLACGTARQNKAPGFDQPKEVVLKICPLKECKQDLESPDKIQEHLCQQHGFYKDLRVKISESDRKLAEELIREAKEEPNNLPKTTISDEGNVKGNENKNSDTNAEEKSSIETTENSAILTGDKSSMETSTESSEINAKSPETSTADADYYESKSEVPYKSCNESIETDSASDKKSSNESTETDSASNKKSSNKSSETDKDKKSSDESTGTGDDALENESLVAENLTEVNANDTKSESTEGADDQDDPLNLQTGETKADDDKVVDSTEVTEKLNEGGKIDRLVIKDIKDLIEPEKGKENGDIKED